MNRNEAERAHGLLYQAAVLSGRTVEEITEEVRKLSEENLITFADAAEAAVRLAAKGGRERMQGNCDTCLHEKVCALWRANECQDAACYSDDCYTPAADYEKVRQRTNCRKAMPDDHIKRSDARAYVRHAYAKGLNPMEYIDEIPAADVEPVRHGRWVKMTGMMPPEFHGHYACSECGWSGKNFEKEFQFRRCPNCGAKMDGEEGNAEIR